MGTLLRRRALAALLIGLPLAAIAQEAPPASEGLDRVRASLRQFTGTGPVRAVVDRSIKSARKDRAPEAGAARLEVSAGPGGITIDYPSPLLESIRAERAQTDPEAPKPMRRLLAELDATDVADLLNRAVALLSDLDGATVLEDAATTWQDRPARQLDLELQVRTSKADSKWVKSSQSKMRLWMTPEGVPLASESAFDVRVGLLMFTFDASDRRTETFARVGDRLVTLRRTSQFDGEGLGESQHSQTETTVTLAKGG